MKKIIIFIFIAINVYSQNHIKINGNVIENTGINDSIIFHSGKLPSKLYETKEIKCFIKKNEFKIDGFFNEPQMYYLSFYKENTKIPYREEMYFIDKTTKNITISRFKDDIIKNNSLSFEYYKNFIPFILNEEGSSFLKFRHTQPEKYDQKIKEYVLNNNDSYVALWNLAERINNQGYKNIYSDILNSFSAKIKKSKLWKNIQNDLNDIHIKIGKGFPLNINLKDTLLNKIDFILPKSNYILIDYWFSRCKPCLEQMPKLKELYQKFNQKGFEIIGISTDKSTNIVLWKKRIIENNIPWINYLDENGVEATKEKIFEFPTNYLVDKKGNVIMKNITLIELEQILNK
jgi:thiol-disulfide isomerase/thioredoxin